MTCAYCGSALPPGALFCGECGRSVSPASAPDARTEAAADTDNEAEAKAEAETETETAGPVEPEPGASEPVSPPPTVQPRFLGESAPGLFSPPLPVDPAPPASQQYEAPAPTEPMTLSEVAATESIAAPKSVGGEEPPTWMPPAPLAEPLLPVPVIPPRPPVPSPEVGLGEPPPEGAIDPLPIDLERTRFLQPGNGAERYVLQFSTGESVVIRGNGLIGRNPFPQPGEFVDQLVTLFDAGKSVSKTHLEFGQAEGKFWISDRFSTNGSVVRLPDTEPRRCDPGKRYLVSRGTRIDIGEQFFIIS